MKPKVRRKQRRQKKYSEFGYAAIRENIGFIQVSLFPSGIFKSFNTKIVKVRITEI